MREAVRGLMIDPADRVLLIRLQFQGWTGWILPGGGKEPGETDAETLRRELTEETGVPEVFMGPLVWTRTMYRREPGEFDGQTEAVYLVPCHAFDVAPTMTAQELEDEGVVEHRWWTVAELEATDDELGPRNLPQLITDVLEHGAPAEPPALEG